MKDDEERERQEGLNGQIRRRSGGAGSTKWNESKVSIMGFIGHHRLILGRFWWEKVRPGGNTLFERKCFSNRITNGICNAI